MEWIMKLLIALRGVLPAVLFAAGMIMAPPAISETAYEAPLPVAINSAPDLCAHVPCAELVPGATSFSERMGKPAYVEAYRFEGSEKKLAGYVFLSTDIVDIPAYSGKPVITLIGMDTPRASSPAPSILRHSEPILLLGIPESVLTKFVKQYLGKFVGDKIEIGKSRNNEGYIGLDAISGATVTVIAQNQVIMRSGVAIARQVGILKVEPKPPIRFSAVDERLGWQQLVEQGSVRRLTVRPEQVGKPRAPEPHIDMHFGYLNHAVGGQERTRRERLQQPDVASEGGRACDLHRCQRYRHPSRVRASCVAASTTACRSPRIWMLTPSAISTTSTCGAVEAVGAPAYKESAIFIIRDPGFSGALPWHLMFLTNKLDRETGQRELRQFRQRVLGTRQVPAGRTTEGGQARRTVGAGVEDARGRDRALLGPADRRGRRVCAARYADPALDAQKQVASQCL
jgi:NosR/NirI family nitrous oxide reductase transcriptional regulator